jgi:hypothetical protein
MCVRYENELNCWSMQNTSNPMKESFAMQNFEEARTPNWNIHSPQIQQCSKWLKKPSVTNKKKFETEES